MPGIALTDHGNLYGAAEFLTVAQSFKELKPIVGCEIYVSKGDHRIKEKGYYHLILLAKDERGYKNLVKIVSTAHIEGMYYRPRVSHEVIEKYHEGLICSSACIAGELPRAIAAGDMKQADEVIAWHKKVFGDDYYLEVMLHKTEVTDLPPSAYQKVIEVYHTQTIVNKAIFELAEKHGVKVIATNDAHFVRKEDGPVHDRLICLTTNSFIDDEDRLRYTQQEYIKSEEEMAALFPDHPEVISNTMEIFDKVTSYSIKKSPILPVFEIDPGFMKGIDAQLEKYKDIIDEGRTDSEGNPRGEGFCHSVAYLCHLTFEGARQRYGDPLTKEQQERIEFELKTISRMGYPDDFLIVQDYIAACRAMGSMVGPGRGSAAGSVVAYCLKITNLDPIKYDLLFERFLNPDRISMPDIDVDFEDLGMAHEYVEKKYGSDHVSRVITFGTMAAKGALKDVARISHVSIDESNRLSKMVPDRLSEKVVKEYPHNPKLDELPEGFKVIEKVVDGKKQTFRRGMEEVDVKVTLENCYRLVPEFKKELEEGSDLNKEVLKYAQALEGTIRQVGVHACATIIGRGDLTNYLPICLSKDKDTGEENLRTSQFDGHYIENVGMLKMDFLGLINLTIIHNCLDLIKERYGKEIDIEKIPIDDKPTYELYGHGDTTGLFQFESAGMRKYLQQLHPERFEDLIAMNALYRPGPMDYIPDFIDRKMGVKAIEYDLPEMEPYLKDTYGITVYQEQVMRLSQALAGFTKGQADTLRKAMGKKQLSTLMELQGKFMEGGLKTGHPEKVLDKIWKDWVKFAQYAFNKSHATCYAWISYQTGWLKCHYPSEFFASCMNNAKDMEEIKKMMDDCKAHSIKVLSPDVNESAAKFTVNKDKNIRFGLGSIKSFGNNIVEAIIADRKENGPFKDVWDFVERMAGTVNRKGVETLVRAGAFDSLGIKRTQFFRNGKSGNLFIDELYNYGENFRNDTVSAETSLFGDMEEMKPERPEVPFLSEEEDQLQILQDEKALVGTYLSSHPLDMYRLEMDTFANTQIQNIPSIIAEKEKELAPPWRLSIAGLVTSSTSKTDRNGRIYGLVTVEDFSGSYEFRLYDKDYENFRPFLGPLERVLIECEVKGRTYQRSDGTTLNSSYRMYIRKVSLLANLAAERLDSFQIEITTPMLNEKFREKLVKVVRKHKGITPLNIFLYDPVTRYRLQFYSKKFPVAVSMEFINDLKQIGIDNYSVKTK